MGVFKSLRNAFDSESQFLFMPLEDKLGYGVSEELS